MQSDAGRQNRVMWSVVARFTTLGEAESARAALDAAGIDAHVADENVVAVDWLMSQAVGGVKVLVPERSLEEAANVLAAAARDATSEDEEAAGGIVPPEGRAEARPTSVADTCPACGSSDVRRVPRLLVFAAVAMIALGLGVAAKQPMLSLIVMAVGGLVVAVTPSRQCRVCDERWTAEEAEPEREESYGPLPAPSEAIEPACPRCGSREYHHVIYRRLRAASLLFSFGFFLIAPVWLLLPKWKCDSCGLRRWFR